LDIIIFIFENEYNDYDQNDSFVDLKSLVRVFKKEFLTEELRELEKLLKLAERKNDQKKIEEITKEFVSSTHRLNNLD